MLHVLVVLGLIKILGRIVLHEDRRINDVVSAISRVHLNTLDVVVDVTLNPGLVLGVQSGHVELDPVAFEGYPVIYILILSSTRNFGA